MLKTSNLTFLIALPILGCATTTPGAQPHDMSTEQHERHAQEEDATAAAHAERYDPNREVNLPHCSLAGHGLRTDQITDFCWTSVRNPTDNHQQQAAEHRRHAANHRAASAALANAEATSCVGIAGGDRDMSPFEHTEDIASVEPLLDGTGAVVVFTAVEGMTTEPFQRLIDCHLARNASLGHVVPEMPNCPLVLRGAEARVSPVPDGFAVSIRSSDPDVAREILTRARRLVRSNAAGHASGSK